MKKSEGINTICKIIKFLKVHVSSYKTPILVKYGEKQNLK